MRMVTATLTLLIPKSLQKPTKKQLLKKRVQEFTIALEDLI
jgi:hypothetical protein